MRAESLMSSPQTFSPPIWGQNGVLSEIHLSKHCALLAIYKPKHPSLILSQEVSHHLSSDYCSDSTQPLISLHMY